MSLKDQITEDMKTAMRAKDTERLGTIRLLLAACKQKEVDERVVLDDVAVIAITDKLIKQRKDSIEAYTKADRKDLADRKPARSPCFRLIFRSACRPMRSPLKSKPSSPNWAPRDRATWAR
jgi:hypothetical protein